MKWIIKAPIYAVLIVVTSPLLVLGGIFYGVEILIYWAFSNESIKKAKRRIDQYDAIHSDF